MKALRLFFLLAAGQAAHAATAARPNAVHDPARGREGDYGRAELRPAARP